MTVEAWKPQRGPQEEAMRAVFVEEVFFGGAAGGGKSDFLLGDYARDIGQGSCWQGILFRRSYPELDELVHRSHEIYPQLGGEFKVGKYEWHFATGAILRLRHMETELDFVRYQGFSVSWLGYDELPNWPNLLHYHRMKSRLRGPAQNKRIRSTGNPGGPGHLAVKEYFGIGDHPKGRILMEGEGGSTRMFIPSRVTDNRILLDADPNYIERLKEVGDEQLVSAWLEGSWDALVGQYFTNWRESRVVVPSFEVPDSWPLFGALDYGESAPSSFGLYAQDYDKKVYRIGGYYASGLAASQHATNVESMIAACPFIHGRRPSRIVADPSMFVKRRLKESVTISPVDVFVEHGLYLTPANNDRITGWRVINDALVRERFFVFDGWNNDLCRTVPALPRARSNPEDVDTDAEDHAADELRYMLMHCYGPSRKHSKSPRPGSGQHVLNELARGPAHSGRYGTARHPIAA